MKFFILIILIFPFVHLANAQSDLEVIGTVKTDSLVVINGAMQDYILVADSFGGTKWVHPDSIITQNDEDWILAGDTIYNDKSTHFGFGTDTPSEKFTFSGGDLTIERGNLTGNLQHILTIEGARSLGGNPFGILQFKNFDVNGDSSEYIGAQISAFNSTDNDAGDLRFFTTDNLILSEKMRIDEIGNVGIGTNDPSANLDVAGTAEFNGNVVFNEGGLSTVDFRVESDTQSHMLFVDASTNEVGIGTNNPSANLDVAGTAEFNGNVVFNEGSLSTVDFRVESDSYNYMLFVDASANNVGIGTSSPTERLEINGGNVFAKGGDFYTGTNGGVINAGGGILNSTYNIFSDSGLPTIISGDEELYIEGSLEIGDSNAYKPGGGTWTATSDKRLKKDISPYEDGLTQLLQINPVKFKYNDKLSLPQPEKEYIGVIAQDMIPIAPYTVEEIAFFQKSHEVENGVDVIDDPGTLYYTFDASALTFMIINAIQEQQEQIDVLAGHKSSNNQTQVEMLIKEIENLKKEIAILKTKTTR